MLQNAHFLAKIGADTAKNEQQFAEILPKTGNYPTGPPPARSETRPRPGADHPAPLSAVPVGPALMRDAGVVAAEDVRRAAGLGREALVWMVQSTRNI